VSLNLSVESIGNVKDSLTGREGDGLTVTLNGKRRSFTWKSLKQVLSMELSEGKQPEPAKPMAGTPATPANGPTVATPLK
jgi:hypothetical protein